MKAESRKAESRKAKGDGGEFSPPSPFGVRGQATLRRFMQQPDKPGLCNRRFNGTSTVFQRYASGISTTAPYI